jgi:hypothetical protein
VSQNKRRIKNKKIKEMEDRSQLKNRDGQGKFLGHFHWISKDQL